MTSIHIPVLPNEVLESLNPSANSIIVDGTFGGGGHAKLIAPLVSPDGKVIGIDRDEEAVERFQNESPDSSAILVLQGSYADIPELLASIGIERIDGVLLDLGLSSDQLADESRGFSFSSQGDLDLRFDTTCGEPAWRLVNRLSAEHLADLIYEFGEERLSRRIARKIVEHRKSHPIRQASQLANIVRSCYPRKRNERIDPATRTFQALRIAVNNELKALEIALRRLPAMLSPGGRMAIISFHSLEDRMVKNAFRSDDRLRVITKKPITATDEELADNTRSRSAKLRVAERVNIQA